MRVILESTKAVLDQLISCLDQLTDEEYAIELDVVGGSSVGMHVRHILEFYTCILDGENCGEICYDNRERVREFETNIEATKQAFSAVLEKIALLDFSKTVYLKANASKDEFVGEDLKSSIGREISYGLDHAIHHMALIKVAITVNFPQVVFDNNFGVAPSTIRYRDSQCAQ